MEARVAAIARARPASRSGCWSIPPLYTAGTSARAGDLLQPGRFPLYRDRPRRPVHLSRARPAGGLCHARPTGRAARSAALCPRPGGMDHPHPCPLQCQGRAPAGRVGIWVARAGGREDKVAAIGVRVRRGVAYHGIAINLDPDLDAFLRHRPLRHRLRRRARFRRHLARRTRYPDLDGRTGYGAEKRLYRGFRGVAGGSGACRGPAEMRRGHSGRPEMSPP